MWRRTVTELAQILKGDSGRHRGVFSLSGSLFPCLYQRQPLSEGSVRAAGEVNVKSVREFREAIPAVLPWATSGPSRVRVLLRGAQGAWPRRGFSTVLSTAMVENASSVMGGLDGGVVQSCTHFVLHIAHN
jgi:hypothetical protein